jgi:hypothetical protein
MLVTVVDGTGRAIVDLGADDFVVAERGQNREVFSVHPANYPVVVLLDTAGSATDVDAVRQAAIRFLERLGAERPVAIGTVADPASLAATIEDDRGTVLEALKKVSPGAERDPLEAIAASIERIAEGELPFSAVALIAGGAGDTALSPNRAELLNTIAGGRSKVHAVLRGENDGLRRASALTRGQYTRIFSMASYQSAVDRLADAFAAEMMVEYLVPAGSGPAADVRVGVKRPGARVLGQGVTR